MAKSVKSKWCATCGRKVDLRKKGATAMSPDFAKLSAKKNREYHFWCSDKCYAGRK